MSIGAYYHRNVPPYHHDGYQLNDGLEILSADVQKGGAPDDYWVVGNGAVDQTITFQHGPRGVEGSVDGLTHEVLLAILIDRCEGFDQGPYPHPENTACLVHLRAAMACCKRRVSERAARNVLGLYEK